MKRQFFFAPAFEIYGGVSGLYDYGPLGSALKNNVESLWRNHFILEDDMLELSCTNMTLGEVLKTSGHVDKFTDSMVKDKKNGNCHRADKLIHDFITARIIKKKNMKPEEREEFDKILRDCEEYSDPELDACIAKYGMKAPDTGNELSEA